MMTSQYFLWRLSRGVCILAAAGAFWLGLGLGPVTWRIGPGVCAAFSATLIACGVALFQAGVRLSRRSGFEPSSPDPAVAPSAALKRRTGIRFLWINAIQFIAINAVIGFCVMEKRPDLIWPLVAIVVSLHFAPLARLFHLRAYYLVAIAGTLLSLAALAQTRIGPQVVVGTGMALILWICAWYLASNATVIAAEAVRSQ